MNQIFEQKLQDIISACETEDGYNPICDFEDVVEDAKEAGINLGSKQELTARVAAEYMLGKVDTRQQVWNGASEDFFYIHSFAEEQGFDLGEQGRDVAELLVKKHLKAINKISKGPATILRNTTEIKHYDRVEQLVEETGIEPEESLSTIAKNIVFGRLCNVYRHCTRTERKNFQRVSGKEDVLHFAETISFAEDHDVEPCERTMNNAANAILTNHIEQYLRCQDAGDNEGVQKQGVIIGHFMEDFNGLITIHPALLGAYKVPELYAGSTIDAPREQVLTGTMSFETDNYRTEIKVSKL